jgi:hypothetical protein
MASARLVDSNEFELTSSLLSFRFIPAFARFLPRPSANPFSNYSNPFRRSSTFFGFSIHRHVRSSQTCFWWTTQKFRNRHIPCVLSVKRSTNHRITQAWTSPRRNWDTNGLRLVGHLSKQGPNLSEKHYLGKWSDKASWTLRPLS